MKRLTILGMAGLGLWSAPALADTGNLLVCVDRGFALQKCQLRDVKEHASGERISVGVQARGG